MRGGPDRKRRLLLRRAAQQSAEADGAGKPERRSLARCWTDVASEAIALCPDSGKRFYTSYSVWGVQLDLDRLLREGRPVAAADTWRRGDYNPLGGGALTAGLSMEIYSGWSERELHEAVATFLSRETELLKAARSQASLIEHSDLTTFISVASNEQLPVGVSLPATLAKSVIDAGMSWIVSASVFPATGVEDE